MITYFRSTIIEKIFKSNFYLLKLSEIIICNFSYIFLPYEKDWFFFKNYNLKKDKIIIDIGAHFGESYYTFRKFFKMNKILCFEPNQRCIESLNKINDKHLKVMNYGLSKELKYKKVYFPSYKNINLFLWGSTNKLKLKKRFMNYTYINIKKIQFKYKKFLFNKFPKINYNQIGIIKIDVEGDELKIIKYLKNIIKINKPLLFIEYNDNFNSIYDFLNKLGYKHYFYDYKKDHLKIFNKEEVKEFVHSKKYSINSIFIQNKQKNLKTS